MPGAQSRIFSHCATNSCVMASASVAAHQPIVKLPANSGGEEVVHEEPVGQSAFVEQDFVQTLILLLVVHV